MERQQSRNWTMFRVTMTIILICLTVVLFWPYSPPDMPEEYYKLPVRSKGTLVCSEEQLPTVWVVGAIRTYLYTDAAGSHHLLETSNVVSIDAFNNETEVLSPFTLFYIHNYIASGHVYVYTRKDKSLYDLVKFLKPRFEKEWELFKDLEYSVLNEEDEAIKFTSETMQEIFGRPCEVYL